MGELIALAAKYSGLLSEAINLMKRASQDINFTESDIKAEIERIKASEKSMMDANWATVQG